MDAQPLCTLAVIQYGRLWRFRVIGVFVHCVFYGFLHKLYCNSLNFCCDLYFFLFMIEVLVNILLKIKFTGDWYLAH